MALQIKMKNIRTFVLFCNVGHIPLLNNGDPKNDFTCSSVEIIMLTELDIGQRLLPREKQVSCIFESERIVECSH